MNKATEQVSNVVQYINERKRLGESQQKIVDIQQSIENCPVSKKRKVIKIINFKTSLFLKSLLQEASRKFEREDDINLFSSEKNKIIKVHLYLFNDSLLVTKPKKKQKILDSYQGSVFYAFFLLKDTKIIDVANTGGLYNKIFQTLYKKKM